MTVYYEGHMGTSKITYLFKIDLYDPSDCHFWKNECWNPMNINSVTFDKKLTESDAMLELL